MNDRIRVNQIRGRLIKALGKVVEVKYFNEPSLIGTLMIDRSGNFIVKNTISWGVVLSNVEKVLVHE